MRRTFVIIHPGALGDLLLALPAIQRLRERYPDHQSILCAQEAGAKLLEECGVVDNWLSMQAGICTPLFGGGQAVKDPLRDWLSRCDLVIAWTQDHEGAFTTSLKAQGAREIVVRSPFDPSLTAVHQSDRFLETLPDMDNGPRTPPALSVPGDFTRRGKAWLVQQEGPSDQPVALLHPGSGSRHKCVAPQILVEVMKQLQQEGLAVLLVEGPADREAVQAVVQLADTKPRVLRDLDLSTLAALLSQAGLYVGHDSGVTHLAALVGTPTVGLFGPTDPKRWAPRGTHVHLVTGEPCRCPTWEDVRACAAKPCLDLSVNHMLEACHLARQRDVNPRISSSTALSLFPPCVRVAG